jgi:hypothetical protein
MKQKTSFILFFVVPLFFVITVQSQPWSNGKVVISSNGHFLQHENGKPFFWLGDTGWLLFQKLDRIETRKYLKDRSEKEFNVIQCMVIQALPEVNRYRNIAFIQNGTLTPCVTMGHDTNDAAQYDYWDHVDWVIDEAARNGLYIALVPIWGSVVKQNDISVSAAESYATFLAERFKKKPNIFWMVGGDIQGNIKQEFWETIGRTLKKHDPNHLITYHPYGRTQSSTWFHNSPWLDVNMFQSGHRRYDQDASPKKYGEDNWQYIRDDYTKIPVKPTLDGEPSYENIPQGLHDTTQPYWTANDVRRYAYWSVFAGACGHTYGNNSVMQMYRPDDQKAAYGARKYWYESLQDSGSVQMKYLKHLILSRPYFDRIFDDSLVINNSGTRYNYIVAMRGTDYLMAYTYTGQEIDVKMGRITGTQVKAWWFNPRNGEAKIIGTFKNEGMIRFIPPMIQAFAHDWVLVLDDCENNFLQPGVPLNLE